MLCRWRRVVDVVVVCVASELCVFTIFGWGMVGLLTLVVVAELVHCFTGFTVIAIEIEGAVVAVALHFRMILLVFEIRVVCVFVWLAWVSVVTWLLSVEHAFESAGVTVIWHEWDDGNLYAFWVNDESLKANRFESFRFVGEWRSTVFSLLNFKMESFRWILGVVDFRSRQLCKSFNRSIKFCEKDCDSNCSKQLPLGNGSDDESWTFNAPSNDGVSLFNKSNSLAERFE